MVSELKDNQLEEKILKADRPVILDFWNEGCGPCQALRSVLEEVSEEEKDIDFYSIQIAQGKKAQSISESWLLPPFFLSRMEP